MIGIKPLMHFIFILKRSSIIHSHLLTGKEHAGAVLASLFPDSRSTTIEFSSLPFVLGLPSSHPDSRISSANRCGAATPQINVPRPDVRDPAAEMKRTHQGEEVIQ